MRHIYLIDLIGGISAALDYMSPTVSGHHRRVTLAAAAIGNHLHLSPQSLMDMLLAGLMHDIGAFPLALTLDGLDFDADMTEHADMGYRLLKDYPFLERAARMVRDHHTPWQELLPKMGEGDDEALLMANIINLADRVDVLRRGGAGLGRDEVREIVGGLPETYFAPEAVEAFRIVADGGLLWGLMEETSGPIRRILGRDLLSQHIPMEELLGISSLFTRIIDFRSRHTATHSQGVAETAVQLAELAGMTSMEQQSMRLAGNLHDIGKLAVPVSLLDKPAKLDPDEYERMQEHALICERVLQPIPGLGPIADWACQHHERLNGKGYPHGLKAQDLSLGSRIMQVADVLTAITEDRPYRRGMEREKAEGVLRSMSDNGFLDSDIVGLAIDHYEEIDAVRRIAQTKALADFRRFSIED